MSSTRVYKYWCTPVSLDDYTALDNQLRLAGDYRRLLVEGDNRSRELQRALLNFPEHNAGLAPDDHDGRRAFRESPEGAAAKKAWRSTEEFKAMRKHINEQHREFVRRARAEIVERGLHWGTYLQVEDAVDIASRETGFGDNVKHAAHRRVAVQIQATKPVSTDDAIGGADTRFRISASRYSLEASDQHGYRARAPGDSYNRGGRLRPKRMQELSIRIGTKAPGRSPIWAKFHMIMHRDLPRGGQVKWVWVQREFVAGSPRWEVCIAVTTDEVSALVHESRVDEMASIDLGWRVRPDGVRVLYWLGTDGFGGELVIPHHVARRYAKSSELRSLRDGHRNQIAAMLSAWASGMGQGTWVGERLSHVMSWTRVSRFVELARDWEASRLHGDQAPLAALQAFLKQDLHLWQWEAHNRRKMERQIRGRVDAFACSLTRKYSRVVVENFDLQDIISKETSTVEDEVMRAINARGVHKFAPGAARDAIKKFALKHRCEVLEADAAYTTVRCSKCGHDRQFEDRASLVLSCDRCGYAEDQDLTACRNLLVIGGEMMMAVARNEQFSTLKPDDDVAKKVKRPRRTRKSATTVATAEVSS